ncbi:hypothetical protein JCM3775_002452 [Rhodotorula graminis]
MSGAFPPGPRASVELALSPSSASPSSRHSGVQLHGHRPTVRVLSSEEDLATRPLSTSTRAHSPCPDQALSSRPAEQAPLSPSLNGLAVASNGLPLLSAQRRASSGGSASGADEYGAASARGSYAQARSPSPSLRPFSGSSSSWAPRDDDEAARQHGARSAMSSPNALSPRPRQHGPVITRVSSPMNPSFSPTDAPLDSLPPQRSLTPSPYLAARPSSRASTFTRRSSTDLLSTLGSPRLSTAPLSEDDVATDLATGGALAREHLATARRASEDSLASVRVRSPLSAVDLPPPPPSSSAPYEPRPFTSLPVASARASPLPTVAAPPAPAPTSRRTAAAAPGHNPLLHAPLTPILSPHTSRPVRNYRLHDGRNRYLCGGRLMTGGDSVLPLVGSLAVAVVLPAAWWVFNGQFLWESWGGKGKASVLVFVYAVAVMWTSMLKTAFSDPGILPRDLDPAPPRKWVLRSASQGGEGSASDGEWQVEAKWIRVKGGGVVASKWCETCKTCRPPRTSHCRLCDNCVERTDHHCAFLNACIGQRNYLSFIAFLLSAVVAGLYSLAFSAYHISRRASASQLRQWDTIGSIVVLVATLAFLVPVGGLAAYHARLVWTNRTTIEMLRPAIARAALSPLTSEPVAANPWERRSGLRNVLAVLCAPGSLAGRESWVDARGWAGRDEREAAVGRFKGRQRGDGGSAA